MRSLLVAAVVLLAAPQVAHAYIGPGAGFAAAGSLLVILTTFLSVISMLFTWPIRLAFRTVRGWRAFSGSRVKKVVILGLDGMDPGLTEAYMAAGLLPNLAQLSQSGCFARLATTCPSISPVAWSSFQTGVNPGKHNIFDFLTPDRHCYAAGLSSVDIRGPRRHVRLGKYLLPIGKPDIRLMRKSEPFWRHLGRHGIFSSVIRVPITFPPEKFRGVMLSGMCVPDLRGSQGTFSLYSTAARGDEHTGGEQVPVVREGKEIRSRLIASQNPYRTDSRPLTCPFVVTIRDESTADIEVSGRRYRLTRGVYSDWINVVFNAAPGRKIRGICQFLLLDAADEFELYVTPINIDPEKPVMPISHPGVYSLYLAKRQGPYATLGLAEDSWALNEGVIDDDAFIQQSVQMDREREAMFFDSLAKVKRGLCVCVFDGTDRIQHTFWRYRDDETLAGQIASEPDHDGDAIAELYARMDALVGRTLKVCDDEDTVVMVISDHGFTAFRYGVDLNRWLEENGYLTIQPDADRNQQDLAAVDWSKTRAYAIGLAGIFLNLRGRESQGIVDPGDEAEQLRQKIATELSALRHPDRDEPVVKQVYNAMKIYDGPYKGNAPDLIVGYHRGYRASWQTAIGRVTDETIHANARPWSGDHCVDPSLVPGVLFCSRPVTSPDPRLMDIGPTVLDLFGVKVPPHMDGRPLAVADADDDRSQTEGPHKAETADGREDAPVNQA